MIGYLNGFLILTATLGSMLLTFRFIILQESFAAAAIAGFLVTFIATIIFWRLPHKLDVKMSYWIVALASFAFTFLRLSFPIEYDRALGWTFVVGVGVALVSLAIFLIFKSSDRYERTR